MRVQDVGFRVQGTVLRVGSGLRIKVFAFQSLGFCKFRLRIQCSGLRLTPWD